MMTKPRMSIFTEEAEFDVSAFAPRSGASRPPATEEVRALSEALDFRSREARPPEPPAEPAATRRKPRRHRTGRTAQLNVRTTPETVAAFYAIADQEGWLVGETVEHALAALQRALAARGPVGE